MRGPIFRNLIEDGAYRLEIEETIADLEQMYTLIIKSRSKTLNTLSSTDERIALISLCQIAYPGKTPEFSNGAKELRARYKGIAENSNLQRLFAQKIKDSLKNSINESSTSFNNINELFLD